MKKLKDKIYGNVIATDDVPIFSVSSRIIEEKISLHLLGAHYSGTLGKYMECQSDLYSCNLKDNSERVYRYFKITDSPQGVIILPCGDNDSICLADFPEFRGISLYGLLQVNASYKGIDATARYFGMDSTRPLAAFNLNSFHFCLKPFQQGEDFIPLDEKVSYETGLQNNLMSWFYNKFPNNIKRNIPVEPESHRNGWMTVIFDFKDCCGQTIMKFVKLYFILQNHTFAKCYIPLTRWYSKDLNNNFVATVGLPGKQILMNLPQIIRAETVVICLSMEDAFSLQRDAPDDGKVAFTAMVCDGEHYEQVDTSPLKDKKVKIMISNHSGRSLAEAYIETVPLHEYLRNNVGLSDIGFIQRQVAYPSLDDVFNIDALMKAHRAQKPHVIEDSVLEFSEAEFPTMCEKAQAEIARKREQSQDLPFWNTSAEGVKVSVPRPSSCLVDNMISRPYIVAGTATVIASAPGMGKSCLATAWGGNIAGSRDPFFDARCLTRCTRPDGRNNKVAYLIYDADGQLAIDDHRRDFAGNIGENDANFIQRNMAGEEIDYSRPANYNAFLAVLNDIRDNEGQRGQPIDVLFIDTLLAFAHNKTGNTFDVFTKLNKDFPHMAIVVIHHLNLSDKTYGGVLTTMGPRVIIKMYRTDEQKVDGRQPTLHDPFTVEIAKFNTNKIPEDGESFVARLDEKNHFIVINPKQQLDALRCILVNEYSAKYKLNQAEIAMLFGASDRTIRNWLSGEKDT